MFQATWKNYHTTNYIVRFFAKFFLYPIRHFLNTCEQQKDNPIYHTKTFMSSTLRVKVAREHDMGSVVYIQKSQQSEYWTTIGYKCKNCAIKINAFGKFFYSLHLWDRFVK